MTVLNKIHAVIRDRGGDALASELVRFAYRKCVRRFLPAFSPVVYAGVPVAQSRRLGDRLLSPFLGPFFTEDQPLYEFGLVTALKQHVKSGDRVVVVGGGIGVTVAVAAHLTGPSGNVICYEGGKAQVLAVNQTVRRNRVEKRVRVIHAVVGAELKLYSEAREAERIEPSELPDCDVLELDCEGSETEILTRMRIRPRVILVESHGVFGSSSTSCGSRLKKIGYAVSDFGVAEPEKSSYCEAQDIRVLAGIRSAMSAGDHASRTG